jgi:hypothetical protein
MASALHFDTETIICGYRRVCRVASDGSQFATWEKVMGRRLPDYMLDAVVFVYPSKEAADEGEESGATGFLIGVPSKGRPTKGHIYAVTNEHVIRHGRSVVRLNKLSGKTATFDLSGAWVPHPDGDDVAIAPLENITDAALASRVLHSDILMNPVEYKNMNVGIGDDVYMAGRFLGHEHRDVNKPVVQQGHIAATITELTNPETNHKQTSILVELRSMSGYSGSVVVLDPPGRILGINYSHLPIKSFVKTVQDGEERETDFYVNTPSGMAAIVPAWKIADMLVMDQFKRQREEEDRRMINKSGRTKPVLDDAVGKPKRKNRDVPVPPISREKFFESLTKVTRKRD